MDPLFDFTGKVVLITGGSRGLGRAMAMAFAERGADLVITSRKLENCEAVAAECEAKGVRALAHGCHVGNWEQLDGLVEALLGCLDANLRRLEEVAADNAAPAGISAEAAYAYLMAFNYRFGEQGESSIETFRTMLEATQWWEAAPPAVLEKGGA